MLKIGIIGAGGKMGIMIASLAVKDGDLEVITALEQESNPVAGKDLGEIIGQETMGVPVTIDLDQALEGVDCVIDFTLPGATTEHLKKCLEKKVPIVIGTTGFSIEEEKTIVDASQDIPIVFSPNMAVGVNVLFDIVADVSRILNSDFTVKVDETHHVHKKDSPSGTAKKIASIIEEFYAEKVPVEAFREGEVIGNHGIVFDSEFETLEIRHNAKSRQVFASGALKAAKYVVGKEPGLYSMRDVLGLG